MSSIFNDSSILTPIKADAGLGVLHATAIRVLLQNWRQGTVGCKDRSEVAFSNKKPWKQKGTGQARAGSRRSPLWRKGGITFGPQPRVRSLKINSNQNNLVFKALLKERFEDKKLFSLDFNMAGKAPKTSDAYKALAALKLQGPILVFLKWDDHSNVNSFRNMANVTVLFFDEPNAFDFTKSKNWLFLKKDLDAFKEMVGKWN